jgi:hypothetical protein
MGLKPAFRASATLLEVSFLKAIVSSLWLKEQVEIRGSRAMGAQKSLAICSDPKGCGLPVERPAGGARAKPVRRE